MNPMWLRQLLAVVRLEIGKSFFSKRGFWIYLLALAPLLIIGGHSIETRFRRERLVRWAQNEPGITEEKFRQITRGMSRDQMFDILGPSTDNDRRNEPRRRERYNYTDGRNEFHVWLRDGEVISTNIRRGCDFGEDVKIFAAIFQFFYLRLMVFFGCVFVFINLFRGEMLDRSLHYYFLAPVRREIVVAGKYLAGVLATGIVFSLSSGLQSLAMNLHYDPLVLEEYLANGGGWWHAFSYMGITALACVGYGSVFLAAGMLLRNPLIPAAVILIWESINGILPSILRKFSVIYYLKSLCPVEVPIDRGVPPPIALLALNVEPVAPWIAVIGLLALAAGLLAISALKVQRLEINYGTE